MVQRGDHAVKASGSAFTWSGRKKAVAPVFVHLGVGRHIEIVSIEINLSGLRVLPPCEPRLHAGRVVSTVGLEAGLAECRPLVGALIGPEPNEVMIVLVVG